MADPLLRVENLIRRFGGIVATDNLSLEVVPGELHAIIGPNGAGKTTLISQLTGQFMPNSGTIQFGGRTSPGCRPTSAAGLGSRVRSRSLRCCRIFPRSITSRSPRKPMTGIRSASGAARGRKGSCATPRRPR